MTKTNHRCITHSRTLTAVHSSGEGFPGLQYLQWKHQQVVGSIMLHLLHKDLTGIPMCVLHLLLKSRYALESFMFALQLMQVYYLSSFP